MARRLTAKMQLVDVGMAATAAGAQASGTVMLAPTGSGGNSGGPSGSVIVAPASALGVIRSFRSGRLAPARTLRRETTPAAAAALLPPAHRFVCHGASVCRWLLFCTPY